MYSSCDLPKTIEIPASKLDDLEYISKNIKDVYDDKIVNKVKNITENCNLSIQSKINNFKNEVSRHYIYYQSIEDKKDLKTLKDKIKIKEKSKLEARKILDKQLKTIAINGIFSIVLEDIDALVSISKLQQKAENIIFTQAVESLSNTYLHSLTTIYNEEIKDIIKRNVSGKVSIDNIYISKLDRKKRRFLYMVNIKVLPLEKNINPISERLEVDAEAYELTPNMNINNIPKDYHVEVLDKLNKYYQTIVNQNELSQLSQEQIISTYENSIEDANYEIRKTEKDIEKLKNSLKKIYSRIKFKCKDDFISCNNDAQKKLVLKIQSLNKDILNTKNKELIYKKTYVETESNNPSYGIAKQVNSVVKQIIQSYSKVESLNMETVVLNGKIIKDTQGNNKELYRNLDKFYIYPIPASGNGFDIVVVNKFKIDSSNKTNDVKYKPSNTIQNKSLINKIKIDSSNKTNDVKYKPSNTIQNKSLNFKHNKLDNIELFDLIKKNKLAYSTSEIKIKAPAIAENGSVIPLGINVDVSSLGKLHIFTDANDEPFIASFLSLSKKDIKNYSIRIRMKKSGTIYALYQDENNNFKLASTHVKVIKGYSIPVNKASDFNKKVRYKCKKGTLKMMIKNYMSKSHYVKELSVFDDNEPIVKVDLTPNISANPFMKFSFNIKNDFKVHVIDNKSKLKVDNVRNRK
jgi:predicted secreted protein